MFYPQLGFILLQNGLDQVELLSVEFWKKWSPLPSLTPFSLLGIRTRALKWHHLHFWILHLTTDIEKRLLALQKQVRAANLAVKPAEVTVLEPSFPKTEAEVLAKESEFFEKLFLPSLLSAAWLPRQGSRVMKHERAYGNLSIIVSTGYRKGLKPIYLPTGIIPRRILSALTTKAVVTQSRFVDVSSISALLKDMNLAINGPQIKRVQKCWDRRDRSR